MNQISATPRGVHIHRSKHNNLNRRGFANSAREGDRTCNYNQNYIFFVVKNQIHIKLAFLTEKKNKQINTNNTKNQLSMSGIITTISPIRSPKKLKKTSSTNNSNIESPVIGLREDFETSINNLVDTALLALKRKILDVKKSSSPSTTTDPLLESYKSQISSDSHIVYDYS